MPTETAPAAPEKDLWQSILHQVSTQTTSRRLGSKTLLVLGDEGSGKSTLIARLQGRKHNTEESPQGTGLEYTYLDVKEEEGGEADVVTRLGVYSLDGNVDHKTLLSFVLNKETVRNTSVLIVVDMARPWLMSDSLNKWAIILEDHMKTIGLEDEVLQEMKTALVKRFQSYTEEATSSGAENREKHGEEGEDTTVLLPLDEGVFTKNIGLPITVVCTKTDSSVSLEKDRDYRSEHFDFIQLYLRRFCVTYGAALFYSGKEGKTKDALYKYILHNAYGLPFNVKAGAPERDIVVIPSGWDNLKKISLLYDGLKTFDPNEPFSTYIMAPAPHKFNTGKEVEVEEEQDFLRRQQVLLNQAGKEDSAGRRPTGATTGLAATPAPATTAAATPSGAPRGSPNTARSTKVTAPAATGPVAATPAPANAGRGGPQNSDVLANFFNSLLNKKPPAGKKEDEKPAA